MNTRLYAPRKRSEGNQPRIAALFDNDPRFQTVSYRDTGTLYRASIRDRQIGNEYDVAGSTDGAVCDEAKRLVAQIVSRKNF